MTVVTDQLPEADTNGVHDILMDSKEYLRKIHAWMRFFGVLTVISLVLGIFGGIVLAAGASSSSSSMSDCLESHSFSYCVNNN